MKNEEIQNIKKILGLQHNKEYSNVSSLRYGRLMIMTDQVSASFTLMTCWLIKLQDHDGSHIKGLLINFLDHHYPSLLKIPNFLVEFVTPIVRVSFCMKVLNCGCQNRVLRYGKASRLRIFSPFRSTSSGWRIRRTRTNGTPSTTRFVVVLLYGCSFADSTC